MVADRVDSPGGWRRNAPTTWFLSEVVRRGWVDGLTLDVPDHPSEVCAGSALRGVDGSRILLIRTRPRGFELPKGGIEFDELPHEAAMRELGEESGYLAPFQSGPLVGDLKYAVGGHTKQVVYYRMDVVSQLVDGGCPTRTLERRWISFTEVSSVPLVHEGLRSILYTAFDSEAPCRPLPYGSSS